MDPYSHHLLTKHVRVEDNGHKERKSETELVLMRGCRFFGYQTASNQWYFSEPTDSKDSMQGVLWKFLRVAF